MDKQKEAMRLIEENNFEGAAKLFIELIDEKPDDPIRYINFANVLFQVKQYEEAERFFLKAIELDEKTATAYFGLGNLYYETSLYDEAEKVFQQAIRIGLNESDVYYMLGMTYMKRGDSTLALPYLQRATELGNDVQMLFQYGLLLAQTSYLREAESILLRVIEKQDTHADALYNLGVIAIHNEAYEEGLHYFTQALSSEPNHQLTTNAKQNVEKILANER